MMGEGEAQLQDKEYTKSIWWFEQNSIGWNTKIIMYYIYIYLMLFASCGLYVFIV